MGNMTKNKKPTDLQINLANQIVELVIKKAMPADSHLKESELAAHFGVSRSPIRGALKLLQKRKIVAARPNHGFFLTQAGKSLSLDTLKLGQSGDEKLYEKIVYDRVMGRVGDLETEADLLRRYKTTRSQLNRTLTRLSREGIVERSQGYGWRFLPALDSEPARDESYAFRIVVEPAGLMESTFSFNHKSAQHARQRHKQLMKNADKKLSASDMFEINADFHEMLAEFSGNRFILQAVQQQNRLRRLLEYHGFHEPGRIRTSCREHLEILDALERGENEWAANLLKRHLSVASDMKIVFNG